MRLAQAPDCHLSYCTNIHAGESWSDVDHALRSYLPAIKTVVSPDRDMGVGLRLSALAARQLTENGEQLQAFKDWLQQQGLYVYTINGFPYGTFHGQPVKEKVYQPDWALRERFEYSCQLARILCALLPERQHGSISTVPIGFKPDFENPQRLDDAVDNLLRMVAYLCKLEHDSGKLIQFALEPEPGCYLETTRDTVTFFQQRLFTDKAIEQLAGHLATTRDGGSADHAGSSYLRPELKSNADVSLIKRHLGVCLDTCHAAVMFESSLAMMKALVEAGIPVHKIQLTAALSVARLTPDIRERLRRFADDVYLHQTCARVDGAEPRADRFYLDLKPALDIAEDNAELRSHFHVPVFAECMGELGTTQKDLSEFLAEFQRAPGCSHLEVETYTFDLLPAELKQGSVVDNISRELNWVKEQLAR